MVDDGFGSEHRRTNTIRKKNRFIALGNKKVCFLNLARKLRTRP